jgi:hypothetical protein
MSEAPFWCGRSLFLCLWRDAANGAATGDHVAGSGCGRSKSDEPCHGPARLSDSAHASHETFQLQERPQTVHDASVHYADFLLIFCLSSARSHKS